MTITIQLTPAEAERLLQTAELYSQPPEGVVYGLLRDGLFPAATTPIDQLPITQESHHSLVQHLLDIGLMTERPTRPLGPPPPPIMVQGRPVSVTLLEERDWTSGNTVFGLQCAC